MEANGESLPQNSSSYETIQSPNIVGINQDGRVKLEEGQEIVRIPVDERMFSSGFMSQQQFTLAQHHSQPTSFYQNQGFYQNSLTHSFQGEFYPQINTPIVNFNSFQSLNHQDQSATEECPGCGRSILSTDLTFDPLNTQYPQFRICKSCCEKQLNVKFNQSGMSRGGYKGKGSKPLKKCSNCGTSITTLWRKFKGIDEIRLKHPKKSLDDSSPDYKGKTGCNACCLYWSLHGKHRPADMKRDHAPSRRKRKKEKSCQSDHARSEISNQPQYMTQFPRLNHFGSTYSNFFSTVKQEDVSSLHSQSFVQNLA